MSHPLQTTVPSLSPLMGLLKIDQLAFVARDDQDEAAIKKMLRLTEADWVEDEVVAKGYVKGADHGTENTAKLLFNYDLGLEVEILRYTEGPNYCDAGEVPSCHLCHIGAHIEKGESIPKEFRDWVLRFPMIQQVETQSHTNKFLVDSGRKYRYTIYDTRQMMGFYFKVIERIEIGDGA